MRQVHLETSDQTHISKMDFISPSEGWVAFSQWLGYTTDSGRTYTKKYITIGNVDYGSYNVDFILSFGITGIKALNSDTILVYGFYGFEPAILLSYNQGSSFTLVYHREATSAVLTYGVTDIVFPEGSQIGFAVEPNRIIKTTNGGANWVVVYQEVNSFFNTIDAVDNSTIFVFNGLENNARLIRSINGGINWQAVNLPPDGKIFSTHFITADRGWMGFTDDISHANLYNTVNAGTDWQRITEPDAPGFGGQEFRFINDSVGYAIYGFQYLIMMTSDYGRTWEPLHRDLDFTYLNFQHNDLEFISNSQFWVGGMHGLVELTTNSGGTPFPKAYFKVDTAGVLASGVVKLNNFSRTNYSYKWFVNNVLISTDYNTQYTHQLTHNRDSITLVVDNGVYSDTLKMEQYFFIPPIPTISSFAPVSAGSGTMVTITGQNLNVITSVKFGGTPATSFSIVSPTQINAIVGPGSTGDVEILTSYITDSSPGFVYIPTSTSPAPTIAGASGLSGKVGTPLTIYGSNFATNLSDNNVFFGTTKATVTGLEINGIQCVVPPGAVESRITLLNKTTGLSATSNFYYSIISPDSTNFTPASFKLEVVEEFQHTSSLRGINAADFDGDGKEDLLLIKYGGLDTIFIYRNSTIPNFQTTFFPRKKIGVLPFIALGGTEIQDVDNDGKMDIVASTNEGFIRYFKNISAPGEINFEPPVDLITAGSTQNAKVVDLDGDGRKDIAVAVYGQQRLTIFRNTGSTGAAAFSPAIDLTTASSLNVEFTDLDEDGLADLVVLNRTPTSEKITIFKNQSSPGTISFQPGIDFPVNHSTLNTGQIFIRDFDQDGKYDILITATRTLYFFRNLSDNGNISLAPAVLFEFTSDAHSYAGSVDNFSGHKRSDFILFSNSSRKVFFFQNESLPGAANLSSPLIKEFSPGLIHNRSIVRDFNNDGKPDVAVTSQTDPYVAIYLNGVGNSVEKYVCAGTAGTILSDLSGTSYRWEWDSGSGFSELSDNTNISGSQNNLLNLINIPASWHNARFRCKVGERYSSTIALIVAGEDNPEVIASTENINFCGGERVKFHASFANVGNAPMFQWQVNEQNATTFSASTTFSTTSLVNNDRVRVIVQLQDGCNVFRYDTSIAITMIQTGNLPSVVISGPTTNVCQGTEVTVTSSIINPGSNPSYQWYVGGVPFGPNSPTLTSTEFPTLASVYLAVLSNATTCGSSVPVLSSTIQLPIQPKLTPYAYISGPSNICEGNSATYNVSQSAHLGSSPAYQWMVNGINVGTNSSSYTSSTLQNNSSVVLKTTSSYYCVTNPIYFSGPIVATVVPRSLPTISLSGNTTLNPGQQAVISTNITLGGSSPGYQWQDSTQSHTWQDIVGGTSNSLSYVPLHSGVKIRCRLTSNATCISATQVFSAPVTLVVNSVTSVPVVPASEYRILAYPNPTLGTVTIDSLRPSDGWKIIELRNNDGRLIFLNQLTLGQRTETLNLNGLSAGVYYAVLRRKNGVAVYIRLVKL